MAYIGDSLAKDVLMAKRAGCFAIWAKYGTKIAPERYDGLVRISHWTTDDIVREKMHSIEAQDTSPDFICEISLSEILRVLSGPSGNEQ